ncbi:MAG: hypothetical protein ABSD28_18395 [Tepidisphaeraceae bacterium]|jgi:hypothetical protein
MPRWLIVILIVGPLAVIGVATMIIMKSEAPAPLASENAAEVVPVPKPALSPAAPKPVFVAVAPTAPIATIPVPIVQPVVAQRPPVLGKIVGSAWSVKNDGTSSLFRGLPLVVLSRETSDIPSLVECLKKQQSDYESLITNYQGMAADQIKLYGPGGELHGMAEPNLYTKEINDLKANVADIKAMIADVQTKATIDRLEAFRLSKQYGGPHLDMSGTPVGEGRTNVDGKFEIDNIPAGDYYLVSFFGSETLVMDWIEPIHIDSESAKSLDLFNDNAVYIHNATN